MENEYKPDVEFEVTLWRKEGSVGTLPVGLGLNERTRQLIFSIGKLASTEKRPWWRVAEHQMLLLEFFLNHKIYFDRPFFGTSERPSRHRERSVLEVHFPAESYGRFRDLLMARATGEEVGRISPKKLYALVEILAFIIKQMDVDAKLDEGEFDEKWDYFLGLLANND